MSYSRIRSGLYRGSRCPLRDKKLAGVVVLRLVGEEVLGLKCDKFVIVEIFEPRYSLGYRLEYLAIHDQKPRFNCIPLLQF